MSQICVFHMALSFYFLISARKKEGIGKNCSTKIGCSTVIVFMSCFSASFCLIQ